MELILDGIIILKVLQKFYFKYETEKTPLALWTAFSNVIQTMTADIIMNTYTLMPSDWHNCHSGDSLGFVTIFPSSMIEIKEKSYWNYY